MGNPTTLSVQASGDSPLTYQWFEGSSGDTSTPVSGVLPSPSFTTLPLTQNSRFWVRVSNGCGSVNSDSVQVFVFAPCVPPAIITQPTSITVDSGGTATFTVSATGSGALNYEWFIGETGETGTPVGTNSNVLTLAGVTSARRVWVRVSNDCGIANSSSATVTLNCTPLPSPLPAAVAETLSGVPYNVTWNAVDGALTYEVQESTSETFAGATTLGTSSNSMNFAHTTGNTPTAFFYRVRAAGNCPLSISAYSEGVKVVIQPSVNPNPVLPTGIEFAIPAGSQATPTYTFLYVPPSELAGSAFTAATDVPWMTVFPSTGTAPAAGINFTVTVEASLLPPGTNFGTINLTFALTKKETAQSNHTSPSITVAVSAVTPVSPVPKSTPRENSMIVPAVAHVGGIGAEFVSDLRITNAAAQTVSYLVILTPSETEPAKSLKQTRVTLESGRTMALNDVVKQWFGFGSQGDGVKGMLEIRPENYNGKFEDLRAAFTTAVSSRTYARTAKGTFGQFVPAIPFSRFLQPGANGPRISLQQVAQSSAFRTNLGLLETSGQAATVSVSVFNNGGQKLGEFSESLRAGEHRQLDQYLATKGIQLNDGRIEVALTSTTGRVSAYASVLDNASSDPMLVAPVRLFEETANRRVISGVADIGTGTARWRSDVRVFNPLPNTIVPLTLRFYPQGAPGSPLTRQISVTAGEVLVLDNVLQDTFGISGATGALHVETATASPLVVTARTFDLQSSGTYGQFIPAVVATDAVGLNERSLNVLQLEQSDPYRTNLGLAEVSGQPATVELNLVLPNSTAGTVLRINLAANEFRQLGSVLALMGASTGYNARISARVIAGAGRVFAYASNIDNLTQDPTYIPGQ